MTIPDGAEYWWDIRGHSYEGKQRSKPRVRAPIVSVEEMISSLEENIRLCHKDKQRVKRTLKHHLKLDSINQAGKLMSYYNFSYKDILIYFIENNVKLED